LGFWWHAVLDRLGLGNAKFEADVHHFGSTIATVDDPSIVEAALLRLARKMAPGSRVELVSGPALPVDPDDQLPARAENAAKERTTDRWTDPRGQAALDVPLRCGASIAGRLRIRSRSGGPSLLRTATVQRLTTLCTMAASAMECLGRHSEWPRDDDQAPSSGVQDDLTARNTAPAPSARPVMVVQDATFLNAVLPFALNQARRHREPLSLLCVAIDRRCGVQELLGRAEVDRLSRHVAEITSSLIRASDIVARLDDDRVVAVLPRAPRGGALHVAENICRAVAAKRPPDCATPMLTVSIGVATFPSCAGAVNALFEAADGALAWAQNHGRNQAVLAPSRPASSASLGSPPAIRCSS
jgi:diguanylate cyclase (GGDEF)-like protein